MTFQDYLNQARAKYARLVVVASKIGAIIEDSFCEGVSICEEVEWGICVKDADGKLVSVSIEDYCNNGIYEVSYMEAEWEEYRNRYHPIREYTGKGCYCDEDGNTYNYEEAEKYQEEWRRNNKN
jgi:uncharacterized protein YpmB